ncbi:hypothetical protein PTR25_19855 [Serratia nevei]|uniref:hypothetical protein n=1 Tax=Serratia TaxID=613 RepID=UPI00313D6CE0
MFKFSCEAKAAAAGVSDDADRAEAAAENAQNIADANTYYITAEDPDGTTAGIAGTAEGKSFRVAIPDSVGNIYLFAYYRNENNSAFYINSEVSYREVLRLDEEVKIGSGIKWSTVNLSAFNAVNANRPCSLRRARTIRRQKRYYH